MAYGTAPQPLFAGHIAARPITPYGGGMILASSTAYSLLSDTTGAERGTGISGSVGDALFASALGDHDRPETASCLQQAIDDLEEKGAPASLHGGFAGLGLVIAMYRKDAEELLVGLDEVLIGEIESLVPASLQSGVAGVALYSSLRSHSPTGRALQRAVVENLEAASLETAGGRVWPTPADYAIERGVNVAGEPVVEYGVVHGIGGALVGLASLAAQGNLPATRLVRDGLAAAWSFARDGENRFGRILFGRNGTLGTLEFAEPRWCVGDPGVLRSLWLAAQSIGDVVHAERALAGLRVEAARDARGDSDLLSGEINLCCGAAAVAQVYLRSHRETGDAVFLTANRTLLARCAAGLERLRDVSFAYGKRGVVLALLAAEREDEPAWDAILGMSLPRAASDVR